MKKIYIILLLTIIANASAGAQVNMSDSVAVSESVELDTTLIKNLQSMSLSYYNSRNTLERDYNFEIYNKQRKLRMWSNEVRVLGYASFLGVCFGVPMLFPDSSLWIIIPSGVVCCGILAGTNIWANNLRKKADALRESSVSILNINAKSSLYIAQYSTEWRQTSGFGIGYKYNF